MPLSGVQFRPRLDSRLKHAGMTDMRNPFPSFKKGGDFTGSRRFERRRHLLMPAALFEFFFVIETECLEHR